MEDAMNMQAVLDAFGAPLERLPTEAIGWCRAHWDEAGPALLERLERHAAGGERTDATANVAMYAVFLLAERGETRAFAPLCQLAREGEAIEIVLGDCIYELLPRLLTPLAGEDMAGMRGVIEEPQADHIVRGGFIIAYVALGLARDTPVEELRDYLRGLFDTMRPRAESYVWYDWARAMIFVSPETAMPLVEALCKREWIDPALSEYADFAEDLREATVGRGRARQALLEEARPLDDFVEEISGWECFRSPKGTATRDRQREARGGFDDEDGDYDDEPGETYVNPWRDVGRNDPCPCGSGLKFKKCCIGKAPPWEATAG